MSRLRPLSDLDQSLIAKEHAPRSSRAQFPVPLTQSTEDPTYCLKVNVHWVAHVQGLLMALDQQDAWRGNGGEIEFARNEARKLIASMEICDDDSGGGSGDMNCVPVGSMIAFWGEEIPDGWLPCIGQQFLTSEYPELAAVLGQAGEYGITPDMGWAVPIGTYTEQEGSPLPSLTLGTFLGETEHTLTTAEIPGHIHDMSHTHSNTPNGMLTNAQQQSGTVIAARLNTAVIYSGNTGSAGGGEPHNNMQPSVAVYYIIRALPCESESETVMSSYVTRQNPENPCQYQYSIDGGTTWLLSFDFNLCFGEMKDSVENIENIVENLETVTGDIEETTINNDNTSNTIIREITINNYDGTPESVDEDAPNDTFDGDTDDVGEDALYRDQALCAATRAIVDSMCEAVVKAFNREQLIVDAFLIGVAIACPPLGPIAGLILFGYNVWKELVDKGSFEDVEARETIACCMYDFLKGKEVSLENFANSLSECETDRTAEDHIKYVIANHGQLTDKANYLMFLKALGQSFRYAEVGILEECPCDENCETLFIPTDPDPAPVVSMTFNTVVGITYQVVVSGTFQVSNSNPSRRADAFYDNEEGNWEDDRINYNGFMINGDDAVTVLGGRPAYQSTHIYTFTLPGTGEPFEFQALQGENDGNDESGLTIEICEVE